jgi:hypothetical protein
LLLACTVYGSPVLETPEVAAARAAHNAAHATARALNALPPAASPIYLEQAVQDTPEVWAARADHYKVIIISQVYISNGEYSRKYNFAVIFSDRLTQQLQLPTESSPPFLPCSLIISRPFPTPRKFGRPNRPTSALTLPPVDNRICPFLLYSTTFLVYQSPARNFRLIPTDFVSSKRDDKTLNVQRSRSNRCPQLKYNYFLTYRLDI